MHLRMLSSVRVACALALLLVGAESHAASHIVTQAEAIRYARAHNGELRVANQELPLAEGAGLKARSYPNPTMEVEGVSGAITGNPHESTVSIGLSQEVVLGGKRDYRQQLARYETVGMVERVANQERLLFHDIRLAWRELQRAREQQHLIGEQENLARQMVAMATQRLAVGDISELDVSLIQAETVNYEARFLEAGQEILTIEQTLRELMGVPPGDEVTFVMELEQPPPLPELTELLGLVPIRPDIKALQADYDRYGAEARLAVAEALPNLTVGVAYSYERTLTEVGGMAERGADHRIGVRLSMPLPLFDRNQGGRVEAWARRNTAAERLQQSRQSGERHVRTTYQQAVQADKLASLYDSAVGDRAEENSRLIHQAYLLGEVGMPTVIEEQRKLLETKERQLAVRYARDVARLRLEAAVGIGFQTISSPGETL